MKEIAATLAPTTLKTFLNSSNRRREWGSRRRGNEEHEAVAVAESKSVAKAQGNAMALEQAVASGSRGVCGRIGQVDYAMRCGA